MSVLNKYPSFSVLMSVYKDDKADYLDLALKSIEKQTVPPKEIVLVEDGPLTDSLYHQIELHNTLSSVKYNIIKLTTNQGLGNALRIGTKYVSTNWIARMDSDDYSVPDRFEQQLHFICEHPEIALVGGQIKEFECTLKNIVGMRKVPFSNNKIRQFAKWRSPFNHPTVMINKKALLEVGGYVPYGNLEDYYLWVRFIVNGYELCNLNKTLLFMRVDSGMYQRRGKVSNIKYFYKLRKLMDSNGLISKSEQIIGNLLMTINILLPDKVRKNIYQHKLHNVK